MASLTRNLARLVGSLAVSDPDLIQAERHVRDWLGSLAAGRATEVGRMLGAYGAGREDLEGRVFLAAALSHVTETDDLHRTSVTHPGCVVIPTAWLLARQLGFRGRKFLRAVLVGYEVMTRVGEALGPGHYRLFHNTATAGVFGSSATAAFLLELDEDAWVWALGNAGTQASGLWEFNTDAAMSKHLHAGQAAVAGLRSALLAREGFTGTEAILEGEQGFFRALCPDPFPEAVLAAGNGWKLWETSLKPYPCCRHAHPAIDAALELAETLQGDTPRRVRIGSYPAALSVTDRPHPANPYAAKFSLQFCVASALLKGRPSLESFEPGAIAEVTQSPFFGSTSVEAIPALATAYPARWGAHLEVETRTGAVHRVTRSTAVGDPDAPLPDMELDTKILELLEYGGIESPAREMILSKCRQFPEDGELIDLPGS